MLRKPSVLVTGAASGIGRACVTLFNKQGCNVVGADIIEAPPSDWDAQIHYVSGDISDPSD